MRRRSLIAALFTGPLMGQTSTVGGCYSPNRLGMARCKPANGECPVCGAMAKPWKVATTFISAQCDDMTLENCKITDRGYGAREIVVRCEACNTAFWQDGEL